MFTVSVVAAKMIVPPIGYPLGFFIYAQDTGRALGAISKYYTAFPSLGMALDLSRMDFPDDFFQSMAPQMQEAFAAMAALEKGAIANPDEGRMVGHYWLRNPALAPEAANIKSFAGEVHGGTVHGASGPFKHQHLLVIGISSSALGPQFVAHALGDPASDKLSVHFAVSVTSETSAVGLLPAALQGIDIKGVISGAKSCDEVARQADVSKNPAAEMALIWSYIDKGLGERSMVVLPYRDRLELFSRYLQQESLGKEKDLPGKVVNQGLSVYGDKDVTDQHAYMQQLRECLSNFFVTFIDVLRDRRGGPSLSVEPGVTSGDFLEGFPLGTRAALCEIGRESITLTFRQLSPFSVGDPIALFDRTVGFYAWLIKSDSVARQDNVVFWSAKLGQSFDVAQISSNIGSEREAETVFNVCEHLAANEHGTSGAGSVRYQVV